MQIPHSLGREEAARRIRELIPKARGMVTDLDEQWHDHTLDFHFKAMGFKVGGAMAVEDTVVNLDIDLPLAAMMVKGTIEQRVRQELGTILGLPSPPSSTPPPQPGT
jgi:hypothetical protein